MNDKTKSKHAAALMARGASLLLDVAMGDGAGSVALIGGGQGGVAPFGVVATTKPARVEELAALWGRWEKEDHPDPADYAGEVVADEGFSEVNHYRPRGGGR